MERRLKGRSFAETRSAILDLIRSSEQVSRIELSERSGLTEATISKVVRTLLDQGFIVESGFAKSTGGKRPMMLSLNTTSLYAVGISLDVTKIAYVLCDLSGHSVDIMTSEGLTSSSPREVMTRVGVELKQFLDSHSLSSDSIIGVGVAGAGHVDSPGGVLHLSRIGDEWEEFPIESALHESSGLPVILDNDANCAALGAFWSGRVPATQDFASIYMATGVGCGIVINGGIYRGASSNAGEIGHVVLDLDGADCWCGSRGCLETMAPPLAIVRRAARNPELMAFLELAPDADVNIAFARIGRAATDGHPAAKALIVDSATYLANALLGIVNVFDLDKLLLAGPSFAEAGEIYLATIREILTHRAFMRATHSIDIELSEVGPDAAALGAASLVLHRRLTPHHSAIR